MNYGSAIARENARLARNVESCKDFYTTIFTLSKPREGANKYIGDMYIQHNPDVGDGIEPFIDYFKRMGKEYPNKKVNFKRSIAQGNYVVLHCHQEWPDYGTDYAGIDIFRLDNNGKVVEHWDVLQTIPDPKVKKPMHNNGMF